MLRPCQKWYASDRSVLDKILLSAKIPNSRTTFHYLGRSSAPLLLTLNDV